jgi:hypothetical protein
MFEGKARSLPCKLLHLVMLQPYSQIFDKAQKAYHGQTRKLTNIKLFKAIFLLHRNKLERLQLLVIPPYSNIYGQGWEQTIIVETLKGVYSGNLHPCL